MKESHNPKAVTPKNLGGETKILDDSLQQETEPEQVKLPRRATKVRTCLEILTRAKGECVSIWHIAQECKSTCAHNLVNSIGKYGAVTTNTQWYEDGIRHSCHQLENWEDFTDLLEGGADA